MKMVSQLTREALRRHCVLSSDAARFSPAALTASAPLSPLPAASLQPIPALPVSALLDPLTAAAASAPSSPLPLPDPAAALPPLPPSGTVSGRPVHAHGIYSQLMKNHDRMTERHLKHT